jgi:hypothetical protein
MLNKGTGYEDISTKYKMVKNTSTHKQFLLFRICAFGYVFCALSIYL